MGRVGTLQVRGFFYHLLQHRPKLKGHADPFAKPGIRIISPAGIRKIKSLVGHVRARAPNSLRGSQKRFIGIYFHRCKPTIPLALGHAEASISYVLIARRPRDPPLVPLPTVENRYLRALLDREAFRHFVNLLQHQELGWRVFPWSNIASFGRQTPPFA